MKLPVLPMSAILIAALPAQFSTSPAGFGSIEGNSRHSDLLSLGSVRFQKVDRTWTRGGPITSLAVRLDGSPTFVHNAPARSWTNFRVLMGFSNLSRLGTTFAANYVTTPTQVFSAALNIPGRSGPYPTAPAPVLFSVGFTVPFVFTSSRGHFLTEIQTIGNTSAGTTAVDAVAPRKNLVSIIGPGCMPGPGVEMEIHSCFEDLGTVWRVHTDVSGAPSSAPVMTYIGASGYVYPGPIPCPCPKRTGVKVMIYPMDPYVILSMGLSNPAGGASQTLTMPPVPSAYGATIHMQALSPHAPSPLGFTLSSYGSLQATRMTPTIGTRTLIGVPSTATTGAIRDIGPIFLH